MMQGLGINFKRSLVGSVALCLLGQPAWAAGTSTDANAKSNAAQSLERILKEASEKGFVELNSNTGTISKAKTSDAKKALEETKVHVMANASMDCEATQALDLWKYSDVDSFDAILKAKARLDHADVQSDVMPVAQKFMSAGLGVEAVSSLKGFSSQEANLLSALGRIVDGVSIPADGALIQSYQTCGSDAMLWSLAVEGAAGELGLHGSDWALSRDQVTRITDLPPHLADIFISKIGIHAGETGQLTLAEKLLFIGESDFRYRKKPHNVSDQNLYFFALVKDLQGNSAAEPIFNYLAQKDGLFQTRALLKLVNQRADEDKPQSQDHLESLHSVQQQYRGKPAAKQASLEIVKQQAIDRKYASAIDLAKAQFSETDEERKSAVEKISAQLISDFGLDDAVAKISALNGYLYDPAFLLIADGADMLQYLAHKSAVELNFPEIAKTISRDVSRVGDTASLFEVDIVLNEAKMALKIADYKSVMSLGLPHVEDPRFRAILIKASLKGEAKAHASKLETALEDGAEKLLYQVRTAQKSHDWKAAQARLQTLEALAKEDFKQTQDLAVMSYVAEGQSGGAPKKRLNSLKDIVGLQESLDANLDIVKAFLTNG